MTTKQIHGIGSIITIAAGVFSLLQGQPTWAQPAATQPAFTQTTQGDIEITITGIEGLVQVRTDEGKAWEPAALGMKLNQGAEFRTGPRSAVRFTIPPDQTITLDRLGTVKVLQAIRDGEKVKTDLGMKYGRTRYDIESAGLDHESVIHSPSATLAIRGTKVSLYDQPPYNVDARSLTGHARTGKSKGKLQGFGKNKPTHVVVGEGTAADTAEVATRVDPTSGSARTGPENLLLLSHAVYGGSDFKNLGVLSYLDESKAGNFQGSLAGALPVGEQLDFSLIWVGAAASNVDLSIRSPKGEILNKDISEVPSSGLFNGDNLADGRGLGQESAQWVISFPPGTYQVTATLLSGGSASVTLFVIQDSLGRGDLIANETRDLTPTTPSVTIPVRAPAPPLP